MLYEEIYSRCVSKATDRVNVRKEFKKNMFDIL